MPTRRAPPSIPDALAEIDAARALAAEEWDRLRVVGSLGVGDLELLDVSECRLEGVDAVGTEVARLTLTDVVLDACDLSGSLLRNASLRRVELRDCRLSGVVLDGSTLHDVAFLSCKLDNASLRSLATQRVEVDSTVLRDADFSGSKLAGARLTSCDLSGARFTQVSGRGLRLHGSRLDGIRGADSLRGALIDERQVGPLAAALLAELGIKVDDDEGSVLPASFSS